MAGHVPRRRPHPRLKRLPCQPNGAWPEILRQWRRRRRWTNRPHPRKNRSPGDTYSALRQDWSRHLAAAERAGVHAIYVRGYKQLRARMEALAENPALEDRPRRSLGNVLAQLDKGTKTRREIEDYLAALKDRLEYRNEVLETVAIDLSKPVTGSHRLWQVAGGHRQAGRDRPAYHGRP